MTYQALNLGSSPGDGTGDTIRGGGDKVNDNFVEIYTALGTGTALSSGISADSSVITLASPVISGALTIADGSASAPSLTNNGDLDTGIYFSAANTVAVATGGTGRVQIDSTGISPISSDGSALGGTTLEWSDLYLADAGIIYFGDDQDVTLTHVHNAGILLNSTMKIQFNDASQFIHGSSATVLSIGATDEIDLTATAVDLNGTLNVSGTLTQTGVATFAARDIHSSGITIANAGQIGSVGDADSIAIASNGVVTFSQIPVIPANSIDSAHYVDGSIDTAHYAAGSVDATALGADCVTAAKIGDNVLNSEHYAAGSIDEEHMAANSIDSDSYVDGSIDTAHLSADCVTAAKIGDNVINSEHYAADSIDQEHMANDSVGSAELKTLSTLLIKNSAGVTQATFHTAGA